MSADQVPMDVDGADAVDSLRAEITSQGMKVRLMKKEGSPDVVKEVEKLTALKKQLDELIKKVGDHEADTFDRKNYEALLNRKMFVVQGFGIYNGVAGLLDFGPPGAALKANVVSEWRRHFIQEENMLEMECTCITPENVFKTSGHVDKFTDFMVKDEKTGECFRADKLLEDAIDDLIAKNPTMPQSEQDAHLVVQRQADAFTSSELHEQLQTYKIVSPTSGNVLSEPFPFNLMFKTTIGPEGNKIGYLRPETAQGLFVNFPRLLEFNNHKMPFAGAQIGLGFRNEISPKNGLLRVREFTMAEIEHFVNPNDKSHPKFYREADTVLKLFPNENQLTDGKIQNITIGEAVEKGMVNNETLGYFMARTYQFLVKIGIDPEKIRFRQHLKSEMAHYAADCWDGEIKTCYGWVECIGHADRACFDLKSHMEATKVNMEAAVTLAQPIPTEVMEIDFNRKILGKTFGKDHKALIAILEALSNEDQATLNANLDESPVVVEGFSVTREMVSFKKTTKMVGEVKFLPSVIEPSFGIGRIVSSLMEHSYYQRPSDEQRLVMQFKPRVAPIKAAIYPLVSKKEYMTVVQQIVDLFNANDVASKVDTTSISIGRRYARNDEIGIPFGITVDQDTLDRRTVTLRDRDSMAQIRVPISKLPYIIKDICSETVNWDWCMNKFPVVSTGSEDDNAGGPLIVVGTIRGKFSRPREFEAKN